MNEMNANHGIFFSRFPCGRWLGKGVDDDSLERVLFVESVIPYESSDNSQNGSTESGSPSQLMTSSFMTGGSQTNLSVVGRSRSPSLRRPNNETSMYSFSIVDVSFSNRFDRCSNKQKYPKRTLSLVGFRKIYIVVRFA